MTSKISSSSLLIFGSGLAALVYQTTWLREFRLIFGNSTAASAAVLGIFMGGLGLGSALLGNRAERTPRPLAFYAALELLIAMSAALTPGLIWLIRGAYVASGGTFAMGVFAGTCVRLLLAAIVVAVPTVLMGGTLPAMARFAVNTDDGNRRGLALLYGMNTLGAVAGAALGTFYLFERFGNHLTLWLACAFNAGIAGIAWFMARKERSPQLNPNTRDHDTARDAGAPLPLILTASAVTGFVFLLMELVWYRMLSPTLGGTAFTFGLILAVALLGIGVGGVMYSLVAGERRPSLQGFASTCALEALFVIIPFALGDRLTVVAMLLQPLGNLGFHGSVLGWSLLCAVIVFPVAVVAGVQFPMLLGLLGRGREGIGRQTGAAYAWNTLGAIVGSLAGGFGLIPVLSAPGTWRLVATLLVLFALAAVIVAQRQRGNPLRALPSLVIAAAVILLLIFAGGPSAAWRHSQLSMLKQYDRSPNETRDLLQSLRRDILWQADGIESSIGISKSQSLAFIVSGKSDGNSKRDAGTQVMSGLLAALMHPNPQRAFVVGLGTGSTAGWLAAVPSMDRVDVVELERVLKRFATQCAPVNHNALANPKINLIIGDGRELLLTSKEKYDLVVSEPSNPYRAGIASLFTREYYEAIAQKLSSGGIFAQWVQAYDIDLRTLHIFYATVSSVFPQIETWQTQSGDLLLLASKDPIQYDLDALRTRIASEPFQSALANVWRTTDLEGVFSHYVGNNQFAHQVMQRPGIPLNTDDQMILEFAFARNRQTGHHLSFEEMRREAHLAAADRPTASGELNWRSVEQQRYGMFVDSDHPRQPEPWMSERQRALAGALGNYTAGNLVGALENWKILQSEPRTPIELMMVAESLAEQGNEDAARYIAQLENIDPTAALALRARLAWRQNRYEEARATMGKALAALHTDPWPLRALISRTIDLAVDMVEQNNAGESDSAIYDALQTPLAVYNNDEERMLALIRVAVSLDRGVQGVRVLRSLAAAEPNVPWNLGFLKIRSACYTASRYPLADEAQTDLVDFAMAEPETMQSSTPAPAKGPRVAEAAR